MKKFLGFLIIFVVYFVNAQQDTILINRLKKEQKTDSLYFLLAKKEETKTLSNQHYKLLIQQALIVGEYKNALAYTYKWENVLKPDEKNTLIYFKLLEYRMKTLYFLGNTPKAIEIGEEILAYYKKVKNTKKVQSMQLNLGLFYAENQDFKSAEKLYQSINITKLSNNSLLTYYTNKTIIDKGLNNKPNTYHSSKKALEITKKLDLKNELSRAYSNVASILIDFEEPRKALVYLDSAYYALTDFEKLKNERLIFQNKYTAWRHLQNLDSAFYYLEKLKIANETYAHQTIETETESLKSAFEKEKRLKAEINSAQLEIEKAKRKRLYFYIAVLVLITLVLILIYLNRLRKEKSKYQQIKLEQKLLRLQMTPHFLFNSLSVLQGMILQNPKIAQKYISSFSRLLRIVLRNSRHQWVSLNSELEGITHYIEMQNLRKQSNILYEINLDTQNTAHILIPPMFIQPYVENAIIHGFKNDGKTHQLKINMQILHKIVICEIIDDGVGIQEIKPNKDSLSGTINKERLAYIFKETKQKGKIEIKNISTENTTGTKVILHIPYKTDKT